MKEFSNLPSHISNKLSDGVRYDEAYLFGKRVSNLLKEVLGSDHPSTLNTLSNMARVLYNQGKYKEALQTYNEVYEKRKDILGADRPNTLNTRSSMALVLDSQGKYEEALQIYNEVYEIWKRILGPDHPDALTTRGNMAAVFDRQGKYGKALQIYNEVYEKRKDILGPDHPDTLTTRSNIAGVFDKQGKYNEALQTYNEVYEIWKHTLGPDHPDTLTTRNNMAVVLDEQGKYDEALRTYNEVYEKRKDILGSDHPDTLTTRSSMAGVLYNQGKYEEALRTYNEVYEKRKDILGPYHPSTLTTRIGMAGVLLKQGKYEEALQICNKIYEIWKRELGPYHPSTLTIRNNMAGVLFEQGEYEEALQIFNEVYEKSKNILGPDHPSTLATWNNMARVLYKQGKYEKALQTYNKVYEKSKDILGPDHPSTLATWNNMARVLYKQGKYEEALQTYNEVYEKRKNILEPDHPDTLTTSSNIAEVFDKQGKYDEALTVYREICEKRNDNVAPLHLIAQNGLKELVRLLLTKGSDVLARNNYDTVLHRAVSSDNEEVIRLILDKIKEKLSQDPQLMYQHINALNNEGDTPLTWAAETGKVSAARILLKYGVDIDAKNNDGMTALHWAAKGSYLSTLQLLLENHASPNIKDKNGKTPLDLAQGKLAQGTGDQDNLKIIETLLLSVTNEPIESLNQLHRAVESSKLDFVEYLIGKGADVNAKDSYGSTPLHLAAKDGYQEIVQLLLNKQADPNIRDKNGKTPLDLAREKLSQGTLDQETETIVGLLLSVTDEIESQQELQKAYLHLSKFISGHFPHVAIESVKQGFYLPTLEQRKVKIKGKCAAITRSFSQILFLQQQDNLLNQPHELFLKNMQTSAELYERLAQGKQISLREEREIFDLSKLLDAFEQQLDSPTSSLLSSLSHIKSYKQSDDLLRYVSDLTGDFAIHLVTSNHVVAIYRTGDTYAYFDSNVAFVSNLKSTFQLIRILEKAVAFAGYEIAEDGFLVEHFNVDQANNALTAEQKQTLMKPIQTERHLLFVQDQKLGPINLNGQELFRTALYDLGTKLHLKGSAPILINFDMNLNSENLLAYLNTGRISITAREYLENLRNNAVGRTQELVQTTKVIPFAGSRNEIKHAQQIQELLSSDVGSKLKSYELSNLLKFPIEKSIKALPYYLDVAKTKHWPDRLTNAAGRIQLIRGVHGAAVSCDRERGNTKDCLLNTGEISLSLVSQLIEDKALSLSKV